MGGSALSSSDTDALLEQHLIYTTRANTCLVHDVKMCIY